MNTYQKTISIPVPIDNFDNKMQDWILEKHGREQLDRYNQIFKLHESIVAEADLAGDRKIITVNDGNSITWKILWVSEEVHMSYMHRISSESRSFYEQMWNEFHEYLGTGYKC